MALSSHARAAGCVVSLWIVGCHTATRQESPRIPSRPGSVSERRAAEEERRRTDWANLARYRADNARLGPPKPGERGVVFMGNSITAGWARYFDTMFPGKPYVA
jgi:hypothetical protein